MLHFLQSLPPLLHPNIRLLILGSFPGKASLTAQQYYAHPRNQFWPLLSAVLEQNLMDLPYAKRLNYLLMRQIGLWDVVGQCQRHGSLDSAIQNAKTQNFYSLRTHCPHLHTIAFNGQYAAQHRTTFSTQGYQTVVLPSSSPAFAGMRFEEKREHWCHVLLSIRPHHSESYSVLSKLTLFN